MYLICSVIFVIIAGFEDNNFSLSGLTQEGHELDVTVISSSSDDDNYDGLLDCARKLAGEISDKTSLEGGIQPGVEPGVEPGVKPGVEPGVEPGPSNFPISETAGSGLFLSNDMASSLSHSEQSIDVSFINFNGL